MPTITASMVVIDSPAAADLPVLPGRFMAARGLDLNTVQVPYITDDDIARVVSKSNLDYPDVSSELREVADQPAVTVWNEARVVRAALDWFDGWLSADELHNTLGVDSPGERHLRRMLRSIKDA